MNGTVPGAVTCPNHYDAPVESRPVFADPSGRRHRVLRFAGIGSMAVLVAFLAAVAMAVTGGPQAPFTHWAVPQASASRAAHSGDQAVTGGNTKPGAPTSPGGSGGTAPAGGGTVPAGGTATAGATTPGQSATAAPSKTPPASASPSASPSPTSGATVSPAASPTATTHGHGHANPHSSKSPKA